MSNNVLKDDAMGCPETANSHLERLLGYGRFQKFQVWAFSSLVSFIGAMNTFQLSFTVTRKPFRCSLPSHLEQNFDFNSFYLDSNITGRCTMAKFNLSGPGCNSSWGTDPRHFYDHPCVDIDQRMPCEFGYTHQTSGPDAFFSLSAENNWVCKYESRGSDLLLAQGLGIIFNSLIFMQLSDTWGRKPVFHITNFMYTASRLLLLITYDNYLVSLLVVGLGSGFYPVGIRVAYIIIAECTNEEGRLQCYIVGWVFWVLGTAFLSMLAWVTGNWFTYTVITTLPNLLLVAFYWLSPESPRFLMTQKKVSRSEKIIRGIKKINRENVPEDFSRKLELISNEISSEKKTGFFGLLASKTMIFIIAMFCVTWTVNDFFYIGGQLNVENLAGNQFVNFAVVAFTEMPSVFIGEYLANRIGRRWSHVLCHFVATALFALMSVLATDKAHGLVVTGLAICAKTASNVGWFINYVQNMEIFPTSARVSGMNFAATVAAVIVLTAPYVILLGEHNPSLMYAIFALVGVSGTIASSFIPESYGEDFPETIEDIEKRRKHKFFSWKVWEDSNLEGGK